MNPNVPLRPLRDLLDDAARMLQELGAGNTPEGCDLLAEIALADQNSFPASGPVERTGGANPITGGF